MHGLLAYNLFNFFQTQTRWKNIRRGSEHHKMSTSELITPSLFTVSGDVINIVIGIHSNVDMQKRLYELLPKNTHLCWLKEDWNEKLQCLH